MTENAYYINGFNTTDPLSGFGGITLPYGAIDQQEIMTGGYGAAFGRSDGGVINQVGKRGTNEWHFGGQVLYPVRSPFRSEELPPVKDGSQGAIRQYRKDDTSWTTTVDAYVGGPLIKDKLFIFAAVEAERQQGQAGLHGNAVHGPLPLRQSEVVRQAGLEHHRQQHPRIDGVSQKVEYQGVFNNFSYPKLTEGGFNSNDTHQEWCGRLFGQVHQLHHR